MKICITGAHFTPAQATIEELKKFTDLEIIYIGRKHTIEGDKTLSLESQVLPKIGVKFFPIVAGRLRRFISLGTFLSLLKIPVGFVQAFYILIKIKPNVILSFGGYVGVPVVICGWLLNIPIILHEQTLICGLANQISSFFADKIAVSFEENSKFKKSKIILTGNPLRKDILHPPKLPNEFQNFFEKARKEKLPVVFFTGGNQGSHAINSAVLGAISDLTKFCFIIHQTGSSKFNDFENLERVGKELDSPQRYLVKKWLGDYMGAVLEKVDLAVSRAGANTLLELSFFGVPTLSIPLPFSSRDEQITNAKFFKKIGLLEILPQNDLNGESLTLKINEMLKNEKSLRKNAQNARKVPISDAAKRLSQETLILGRGS